MAHGVKITGSKITAKKGKDPYVVVGFEVNYPDAFTEDKVFFSKHWVHHLNIDYGHGFFYVVDDLNGKVVKFFSFGPDGPGKRGWLNKGDTVHPNKWDTGAIIKDSYADSRIGSPDYSISEATKLFRIKITDSQYLKIIQETDEVRDKIISGKQKYIAWANKTCAESARDVLIDAGIAAPSGTGWISMPPVWVYAVTPYKWHYNFKKAGYKEARYIANKMIWNKIINDAKAGRIINPDPVATQW